MITRYLLPLVSFFGILFAIRSVVIGQAQLPVNPPFNEPARSPFEGYIAGAGIIEPSSEFVNVGTPLSGVVLERLVKQGDKVTKGQPLFRLDDREIRAELARVQAEVATYRAQLERLQNAPRREEVTVSQARVNSSKTALKEAQKTLELAEKVSDKRAISREEMIRREYAVENAEAAVELAEANHSLLRAGSWAADVAVAESQLAAAEARRLAVETTLARHTINASIDGTVLQVNIREGEFAQAGALTVPLMVLGSIDRLHVRIDVDENDAWRFKSGARAFAYIRGNGSLGSALEFVRIEPYVIPKRSLTGTATERVDTRVLQVLYAFDATALQAYVGQQMDVFIEAELLKGFQSMAPQKPQS